MPPSQPFPLSCPAEPIPPPLAGQSEKLQSMHPRTRLAPTEPGPRAPDGGPLRSVRRWSSNSPSIQNARHVARRSGLRITDQVDLYFTKGGTSRVLLHCFSPIASPTIARTSGYLLQRILKLRFSALQVCEIFSIRFFCKLELFANSTGLFADWVVEDSRSRRRGHSQPRPFNPFQRKQQPIEMGREYFPHPPPKTGDGREIDAPPPFPTRCHFTRMPVHTNDVGDELASRALKLCIGVFWGGKTY